MSLINFNEYVISQTSQIIGGNDNQVRTTFANPSEKGKITEDILHDENDNCTPDAGECVDIIS